MLGSEWEVTMKTDYLFLCVVMWTQSVSEDTGPELVCVLHSDDTDIAVTPSTLLETRLTHQKDPLSVTAI